MPIRGGWNSLARPAEFHAQVKIAGRNVNQLGKVEAFMNWARNVPMVPKAEIRKAKRGGCTASFC
jgi:hypothetical protein